MATKKADFRQSTAAMFLTLKDEQNQEMQTGLEGENLVSNIPISEIDDFPEHPFHVVVDDAMNEMVESIKQFGVLSPAIARKKEDGRYELVSGHRRKKACELAGLESLPVIVRDMDRDEAIIFMVDSNLQREKLLPSEKAFSYKMRLEAMKRKAGRPMKNASPLATNYSAGRSDDELAKIVGEGKDNIRRYIRLTELASPLMEVPISRDLAGKIEDLANRVEKLAKPRFAGLTISKREIT